MAVSLNGLNKAFAANATSLLANLSGRGIEMRPCAAVRTPQVQAALWRQSRAKEQINAAISNLEKHGGDYLAKVLADVGPQNGPHVTNALPGYSWHQWGEAIDCFWAVDGIAEWSETRLANGVNGYKVYAASAHSFKVFAGGNWTGFKDWPHIQARESASPLAEGLTIKEINNAMKNLYS